MDNSKDLINDIKIPDVNIDNDLKQVEENIDDVKKVTNTSNINPILDDIEEIIEKSLNDTKNQSINIPRKM